MKLQIKNVPCVLGMLSLFASTGSMLADDQTTTAMNTNLPSASDTRHGFFNWLDSRSSYGQGVYPEPFLVDDSDLEVNEARLDWLHTAAGSSKTDLVTAEVEKGFGLLTLELEVPYERDSDSGDISQGMANIDVGARYPVYQFVSANGFFDTTFGVAAEIGIPTESAVSKNTEVVPKVFNDIKLGEHLTMQSIFGYSMLFGPGEEGGLHTFEYGFVFGYTLQHQDLPLPGVQQLIPVFELVGDTTLNNGVSGENSLIGNAGFRLNLKTIGRVQPRLGLGFVFPLNSLARADVHEGIATSLVFEY